MSNTNTLEALNGILFDQLRRLNDPNCKGEALKEEVERGKALSTGARDVVSNAALVLEAQKFRQDAGLTARNAMPNMLIGGE